MSLSLHHVFIMSLSLHHEPEKFRLMELNSNYETQMFLSLTPQRSPDENVSALNGDLPQSDDRLFFEFQRIHLGK
ncbi:hypothetical protein JOQ06_021640 [Pogonophryne albipinna]|uniref:Uncharacterized protein n=1 Tax=Pogonophryne albipinna TaxID=1090488 RepID=A0AAD6F2H7_9TELE|nr:hypothetical protein JOQ06_021640 [Pogonophryne albipinna]